MAILAGVPGVEVFVLVDGDPLTEYNADEGEDSEPKTLTKFIEARTGAAFGVGARFRNSFVADKEAIVMSIFLRGKHITSEVRRRQSLLEHRMFQICGFTRLIQGKYQNVKLKFSELEVSDATSISDVAAMREHQNLGTLTVELYKVTGVKSGVLDLGHSYVPRDMGTVPEKDLKGKAITHDVKFEIDGPSTAKGYNTFDPVTKTDRIAVFHFKFRSLEALKQLRVIPRTPSPTAPDVKRPDDMTVEEMRTYIREVQANRARERLPIDVTPRLGVKTETSVHENEVEVVEQRGAKRKAEIIDLTDC